MLQCSTDDTNGVNINKYQSVLIGAHVVNDDVLVEVIPVCVDVDCR